MNPKQRVWYCPCHGDTMIRRLWLRWHLRGTQTKKLVVVTSESLGTRAIWIRVR